MTIVGPGHDPVAICAEVATTEAERMEGLRGREALEPGEGLLLRSPVAGQVCVVNRGVSFDIDVAYAAPDGTVVALERAVPAGDPTLRCHDAVIDVLETASAELTAVEVGDVLSP